MSRNQRLVLLGVAAVIAVVTVVVLIGSGGSDTPAATSGAATVTVKSDTADEVHFHGYDVHKDVAKGGSVHFKFPAKIDGKFIVELEQHKQTLANVTVEP